MGPWPSGWRQTWSAPASRCAWIASAAAVGEAVAAAVEMRMGRLGDGVGRAVGDDGVDEAVAAAVRDVLLREAEAQEIAGVVGESQVGGRVLARDLAGAGGVRLEDHGDLGGDQHPRSDAIAREAGVLRGGEVGVGAERALRGEVEHLRPERGGEPLIARHGLLSGVEAVEEVAHGLQRPRVVRGRLGMPDADAEDEAARELALELRTAGRHVGRRVLPDVEDARGDRERLGGLEEGPDLRERGAAPEPQRAEAEALDLRAALAAGTAGHPDPDAPEVRHAASDASRGRGPCSASKRSLTSPNAASARSRVARSCVAMTLVRRSAPPGGTAGCSATLTKTPAS